MTNWVNDILDTYHLGNYRNEESYYERLKLAHAKEDFNNFVVEKLENITGFSGTYNMDMTDIIKILFLLAEKPMHQLDVISIVNLPERYVNLIYAVCDDNELMEYGSNLQSAWITDLGRESIDPFKCELYFDYMRKKLNVSS